MHLGACSTFKIVHIVHIEFFTFKAIDKTGNSIRITDHIDIRHFEKEVLFSYSIFMLNLDLMYGYFSKSY